MVTIFLFFQNCSPFKEVTSQDTKIFGIYSNDCDSIENKYATKEKLWQTIDKNYSSEKAGLIVKLQENQNHKLFAQLIDNDSIISEKTIKGHFKNDKCYYKRRSFYVIPILPVLWWYKNIQTRLYQDQNYLILEEKDDTGGVIIIMAGGNSINTKRFYKRMR